MVTQEACKKNSFLLLSHLKIVVRSAAIQMADVACLVPVDGLDHRTILFSEDFSD